MDVGPLRVGLEGSWLSAGAEVAGRQGGQGGGGRPADEVEDEEDGPLQEGGRRQPEVVDGEFRPHRGQVVLRHVHGPADGEEVRPEDGLQGDVGLAEEQELLLQGEQGHPPTEGPLLQEGDPGGLVRQGHALREGLCRAVVRVRGGQAPEEDPQVEEFLHKVVVEKRLQS